MAILSKDRIALQASASDKAEAIRKSGELLVKSGYVLPGYITGMLAREKSMSTSLGNGVAIPHGVFRSRKHILQAGISVLQLADGVEWDKSAKVYLIIAIASLSDEHVDVLTNLARLVDDKNKLTELFTTNDPDIILKHLNIN